MESILRLVEVGPYDINGFSLLVISNSGTIGYKSLDWTNLIFPGTLNLSVLLFGCNLLLLLCKGELLEGNWVGLFCYPLHGLSRDCILFVPFFLQGYLLIPISVSFWKEFGLDCFANLFTRSWPDVSIQCCYILYLWSISCFIVSLWPYDISCLPNGINCTTIWINVGLPSASLDWNYSSWKFHVFCHKNLLYRSILLFPFMELYILHQISLSNWNSLWTTCCKEGTSQFLIWLITNALAYLFSWEFNDNVIFSITLLNGSQVMPMYLSILRGSI